MPSILCLPSPSSPSSGSGAVKQSSVLDQCEELGYIDMTNSYGRQLVKRKNGLKGVKEDEPMSPRSLHAVSPRTLNRIVVFPMCLKFSAEKKYERDVSVGSEIKVSNFSTEPVAYRVLTNVPDHYFIKPKYGLIKEKSFARIQVLAQDIATLPLHAQILIQVAPLAAVKWTKYGNWNPEQFWRQVKVVG